MEEIGAATAVYVTGATAAIHTSIISLGSLKAF